MLRHIRTIVSIGVLLNLGLGLPAHADDGGGILSVVKGNVQVQSGKDKSISPARVGMKVTQGDTIITGPDSRAKLTMVDKNVINVSPDSKLQLEKYEFKPDQDKKNVTLNVLFGKVRSSVEQKYDGEQNKFHVKTPSAVAGVRGTDFLVSYSRTDSASKIVTFSGQVEVGPKLDASGKISDGVRVNPGQTTTATPNSRPSTPVAVPASELNNMKRESASEPQGDKSAAAGGPGGKQEGDKKSDDKGEKDSKKDGNKEASKEGGKDGNKEASKDGAKEGSKEGNKEAKQDGGNREGGAKEGNKEAKQEGGKDSKQEPKNADGNKESKKEGGNSAARPEPAAKEGGSKEAGTKTGSSPNSGGTAAAPGTGPNGGTNAGGPAGPEGGSSSRGPASVAPMGPPTAGGPAGAPPPPMGGGVSMPPPMMGGGMMAPTIGDMTNVNPTMPDFKTPPPMPVMPPPIYSPIADLPPVINPDLIRNGNTRLIINVR